MRPAKRTGAADADAEAATAERPTPHWPRLSPAGCASATTE